MTNQKHTKEPLVIEQLWLITKQRDELREALKKLSERCSECWGDLPPSVQRLTAEAELILTKTKESV